jgi:hypothetical protein
MLTNHRSEDVTHCDRLPALELRGGAPPPAINWPGKLAVVRFAMFEWTCQRRCHSPWHEVYFWWRIGAQSPALGITPQPEHCE